MRILLFLLRLPQALVAVILFGVWTSGLAVVTALEMKLASWKRNRKRNR